MPIHYTFLLWPHANVRYRAEAQKLAQAELQIILNSCAPEAAVTPVEHLGMPALSIEAPAPLPEPALERLRRHSLLFGLYLNDGDKLVPVAGRAAARLGEDLPGILKYKGKTNELFTQMLINVGLYSAPLRTPDDTVRFLDPMCGRGTSLFIAANLGYEATGSDIDRAALKEGEQFLKRYFEYHRMKHAFQRSSLTVNGKSAPCARFTFEDQSLSFVELDAANVRKCFGAGRFHVIACDLPYGVQHSTKASNAEGLLARALPAWREALVPGGAVAVSFNAQTAKRDNILQAMQREFSHWVEQAVTRDVAVGINDAKIRRS